MKHVLYRYRDSESVIRAMDGYTPGEGWEPLYDQAAIDADIAAERDHIDKVESEVAALKAERDALLELLVFAASTIKSEYPESQWDEYRIPEIDAAIAKEEGRKE